MEVWRGVEGRARGQNSHQMRKMMGRIPTSCQMAQDQNLQRGVTNTNICSHAAPKQKRMQTSIQKHTHVHRRRQKPHFPCVSQQSRLSIYHSISSVFHCRQPPGFVYLSYSHISLSICIYHFFRMFSITPHPQFF